ncbi:capping protein-inhibiting regulator of actin dynamics [Indicator indicator]|uniref:capping protein-inhibiting regulator of actin dynamics n=1 Tax=Indicator indicator TaxID=1002788 RepID=UPI0023DF49BA|nr:capping protein-inhibiting regulator of actin dynamics [Indicator indicator]
MGSRAFSHDSIFIPDGRTESDQAIQAMSQENVLGKVKTLQQQLAKNIKFGQPSQMTVSVRAMEEANPSMEEDVLLGAPMEIETQQDTGISDSGNKFPDTPEFVRTLNRPGAGRGMEEKVPPIKSSRPKRQFSCSGTIETINLDAVPQAVARLDNSAAKHKLAVKPKKQRMSRKHKRLTKGSQSLTITEFEPEDLEMKLYGDRYPGYNGHIIADKIIQNRSEQQQLQLAEERRTEDHWSILEAERIRQIVEMEEQRDLEEQRCQELEQKHKEQERRQCGEEKQRVLEGEPTLNIEHQASQKEERRLLEGEDRQELEEQRHQELEKQRQELEEQQGQDLEEQKCQERKEQKRQELEEQRHQEWEEQQRQELEKQKHQQQEEKKRQELEEQRHQEWEEQQKQELEKQKHQEQEKKKRELEEQKHQELKEKRRQELEEQQHQEQEEQKRRELEEQKHQEQEEQQRRELEEQKHQNKEEQKRRKLEKQKHQEQEEQERQELEEQKLQKQEEQERQELEEQKLQEQEEQRHQELEEQKHQQWEEQRCKELKEKQRQELEEQKRLELEERRQHEAEKQCQEEGEGKWHKEQKELKEQNEEGKQRQELEEKELQEAEIKPKHETEVKSVEQQKKEEEQRQHLKEKGGKTEKEQPQQAVDRRKYREEHKKHKLTKQMHLESAESVLQEELAPQEQQNEREWNKLEEQRLNTGQNPHQNQQEKSLEEPQDKDQLRSGGADRHPVEEKLQEALRSQKLKTERGEKTAEEVQAQKLKKEVEAQEQKRIGEELRWQEVDERQTASRPFTFQVSSGDKQIIFQKVNLSPVMPVKGAGLPSVPSKECRLQAAGQGPPRLPAAGCVPHTAILVTGAQLCGTAVNLHQIKDSACKSLLGLTEDRRNVEIPSLEKGRRKPQDPKPGGSSKVRYGQEAAENQAVLAEWASIRSRILKNAESSRYGEKERGGGCRHSDDWTPRGRAAPHGSLRKTLSANAKFSITPAWQKFSEASRASPGAESVGAVKGSAAEAGGRVAISKEEVAATGKENLAGKAKEKVEAHGNTTDNTEGCKFAKDLPSFLVPSFPPSSGKELSQAELPSAAENQQNSSTKKADKAAANGEENVSPFGIKLRRTNYSLRFHYDQQAEQRKKKRYSAGDSFDGVPDPLVTMEGEKEASGFAAEENTSPGMGRGSVPAHSKDDSVTVVEASQPPGTPVTLPATAQSSVALHEKPACKPLATQKPAIAPKPSSQTPPASPLAKLNRSSLADTLGQRLVKAESECGWRKEDRAHPVYPAPAHECKNEEEEVREKKSFFPSLSIPWREKNDKKPEPPKKEKPVLQSRHSLDGSKLMEKVETSQPLWITLALQKQKGFREQQATREERRQAREAKQAERLAKEIAAASNQSDNKSTSSSSSKPSTLQKSTTQEGEKKTETAVTRLERRDQLKKSNTLPTSVTVEISDSVPSTPLAKEVAKRFSTPDANPVSTEPAWLALAKRKAKAWSDCPQIIK